MNSMMQLLTVKGVGKAYSDLTSTFRIMLEVLFGLKRKFKKYWILKDISFTAQSGEGIV